MAFIDMWHEKEKELTCEVTENFEVIHYSGITYPIPAD